MNSAEIQIHKIKDYFYEVEKNGNYVAMDNNLLHDLLNDSCVFVEDTKNYEVWTFSDGSCIARKSDNYKIVSDVSELFDLN